MRCALVLVAACAGDSPTGAPGVTCGDGFREEFENCDDGNRIPGDGCDDVCQPEPLVTVTWAFYPTLGGPPQLDCRAGVAAIELVTEVNTTARFPCDDKRAGTIFVPPLARVFARLRGAADEIVAESLPVQPPSTWRVEAPFHEDAGYIRASLPTMMGNCGATVVLTLTDDQQQTTQQSLRCRDGTATTLVTSTPIRAGTYDIAFRTAFFGELARTGVVVGANDRVTELAF